MSIADGLAAEHSYGRHRDQPVPYCQDCRVEGSLDTPPTRTVKLTFDEADMLALALGGLRNTNLFTPSERERYEHLRAVLQLVKNETAGAA